MSSNSINMLYYQEYLNKMICTHPGYEPPVLNETLMNNIKQIATACCSCYLLQDILKEFITFDPLGISVL